MRHSRRAFLAGVALALTGLALTGCSASDSTSDDPSSHATSLWSQRTAYVGDNSRMIALVNAAGFGPQGSYTVSLQTTDKPYGVTVDYRKIDKPFDEVDFSENATLVLGLVEYLDQVSVTSGTQSYTLTAAVASNRLGYDVKVLGQDKAKLEAYITSSND